MKSRISALVSAEEEKEIEALREDVASIPQSEAPSKTSLPMAIPISAPISSQMLLQNQHSTMAVLTPIQSCSKEEPKKKNLPHINLAEFEGYSTTPFEEMELKTLNDKEELAMLLQPSNPPPTTFIMPNMYPNYPSNWAEIGRSLPAFQPVQHPHYHPPHFLSNGNTVLYGNTLDQNLSKLSFNKNPPAGDVGEAASSKGILRQAKSVPDLSEMKTTNERETDLSAIASASPDKRLNSRTPPPRFTLNQMPRPTANQCSSLKNPPSDLERNFSSAETRLVDQLSNMGFPRERAAKVVKRLGPNEKDVVDQLLTSQKCIDLGFKAEHVELALDVLEPQKDFHQHLQKHLELFNQLLALGFPEERIGSALIAVSHDRDKAIDILLMM